MKEIITSCGKIRGIACENHIEYRGIRYATAERFEYPRQVISWDGIYDATEFRDCSYQRRSFEDDAVCNKFYHREFRDSLSFTYSEDSLFLNIYTPLKAENCPVLIYIHGGSFTGGSSNEGHIDGTGMTQEGIIFVSFNYRLGPFGFCSHPDLTDQNGVCGNFGLYDQYTAMKWIRENIRSFGGNPDRITIMGQSAGAMSVDIHASSPIEKDWFSGIVMSSGAGLQRLLLKPYTPEKTRKFWDQVIVNTGVKSMEELKKVDPKTLYYAWFDACKSFRFSVPYTLPVYDGRLVTKDTFKTDTIPDVSCMIGMTITDMMPIVLKHLICKWNRYYKRNRNKINNSHRKGKAVSRCYTYIFTRRLPGDQKGAWHSSDLLYFFGTLKHNWRPFEAFDYAISDQMQKALAAFVKNRDPNCSEIPAWNHNYKQPMTFCEHTRPMKWNSKLLLKNTISKGAKE